MGRLIATFFDQTEFRLQPRSRWPQQPHLRERRTLDQVLAELKPGDFVLMQFGHKRWRAVNDARAHEALCAVWQ